KTENMLGSIMAQVPPAPAPDHHAVLTEKPGPADLAALGPSRRAIGRDPLRLARAQDRHRCRHSNGRYPAGRGDIATLLEDMRGIGVEGEPPQKERRRLIDRPPKQFEPWRAELGLKAEPPSRPFRRHPDEGEHDEGDEKDLPPKDLGAIHDNAESEELWP